MSPSGQSSGADSSDEVARLIHLAGVRPAPSAALENSVRTAVELEWRAAVNRRRTIRTWRRGVAAGLVAVALGLGYVLLRQVVESPPLFVGTIVGTRGPVQVAPLVGRALIVAGDPLMAGSRIETGPSGAALLTLGSVVIRVGAATLLSLERPGQLHLVRGQLYVDGGETPDFNTLANTLVVVTEFGSLTHFGTRYQVHVQPGQFMDASVREGQVRVKAFGRAQTIERGEGLHISEDKVITRVAVPTFDPQWQWVSDFVPAYSIEGRPLSAFLDWFARETGRTLTYVLPATRMATDQTTLSGNISGLTPVQALNAIMATTQFQCDLSSPGQIRVSVRAHARASINRHAATPVPSY